MSVQTVGCACYSVAAQLVCAAPLYVRFDCVKEWRTLKNWAFELRGLQPVWDLLGLYAVVLKGTRENK